MKPTARLLVNHSWVASHFLREKSQWQVSVSATYQCVYGIFHGGTKTGSEAR